VSGTRHFTSRVQVEDIELSRKVLYCFAIDSIVNEILIFENRWMRAYPLGPPPNASARRCMSAVNYWVNCKIVEDFYLVWHPLPAHERWSDRWLTLSIIKFLTIIIYKDTLLLDIEGILTKYDRKKSRSYCGTIICRRTPWISSGNGLLSIKVRNQR